MKREFLFLRY